MSSREPYERFARFYDTYVRGFREDLALYLSLCDGREPILEIGCGTGRVLAALLAAGHDVVGVDISPEMLSIAEKKLAPHLQDGSLKLLIHDFRRSTMEEEFGCVLVTFYTFNYVLEDEEQEEFLRHVYRAMANKAVIVLDLFYPQSRSDPSTEGQWQQSTYQMGERSISLMQSRRMVGEIEERVQLYVEGAKREEILTRRRYNSKHKMLCLLAGAGFADVGIADGYSLSDLHDLRDGEQTTSSFVVVAKKP